MTIKSTSMTACKNKIYVIVNIFKLKFSPFIYDFYYNMNS